MSVIGTIAVNVVSRHTQFVRGMNDSRRAVGRLAGGVAAADRTMRLLGRTMAIGFAVFTTGRLVSSIRATAEQLDALGKTSDKLGIASEKLAGLRLGAELEGIGEGTLDKSLERMVRRIGDVAATGKGEALPALEALRLEAGKLAQTTPDQMLAQVADRLVSVESQTERVRLAYRLFGREGVAMTNMLRGGAAGLEEYHRQAEQLGIAISRDRIKQVEEFNDAMTRLGKAVGGFKERIVIDITPAATAGVKMLEEAIAGTKVIMRDLGRPQGRVSASEGLRGWLRFVPGMGMLAHPVESHNITEQGITRRLLGMGVAAGTPAPSLSQLGVGGVASLMAREPGFDPNRVWEARLNAIHASNMRAEAQAIPTIVRMGREAGKRWIDSFTSIIESQSLKEGGKVKTLGERIRESIGSVRESLVQSQRDLLVGAFTGRLHAGAADFRAAMAKMRDRQLPTDPFSAPNEALERGTAAAYLASRQSDRVNRILQEQLGAQNQMAVGIRELVAQGRQALEDTFGAGV